jgi:hypothetical protein
MIEKELGETLRTVVMVDRSEVASRKGYMCLLAPIRRYL